MQPFRPTTSPFRPFCHPHALLHIRLLSLARLPFSESESLHFRLLCCLIYVLTGYCPLLNPSHALSQIRLLSLARLPFSESEPLHFRLLCSLFSVFTGHRPELPRLGSHWAELGFQGQDPATDLRASGMLGLLHMYLLYQVGSVWKDVWESVEKCEMSEACEHALRSVETMPMPQQDRLRLSQQPAWCFAPLLLTHLTLNFTLILCVWFVFLYAQHDAVNASRLYRLSRSAEQEFPLAVVSLNITKWTVQVRKGPSGQSQCKRPAEGVHPKSLG